MADLTPNKPDYYYVQSAVVPVRMRADGLQVLLISSRKRKRWVLPKGIVEPDLTPAASAAKEAWEEAGIRGEVIPHPLGSYDYEKWGGLCSVTVFLMRVTAQADAWPEDFRLREWLPAQDAAARVQEQALAAILSGLPGRLDE